MTSEQLTKAFRDGDHAAYWLLRGIFQSLNFPSLPLEQSLAETVSKTVLDNAANWVGMDRPEPAYGHVFSAEAIATLRRKWPSALGAD